jgi:hypothetical protein
MTNSSDELEIMFYKNIVVKHFIRKKIEMVAKINKHCGITFESNCCEV